MNKLNNDEIKDIQLNILNAVHLFCEENHLTYFLTGGTLIGAIRHRGYIPWDDDIDIMMLRVDYEQFVSRFNSLSSHYKVYTCFNDQRMKYPFAKISDERTILIENTNGLMPELGVSIDLFPIDSLPVDETKVDRIIRIERRYKRLIGLYGISNIERGIIKNTIINVVRFFVRLRNINKIARKMNTIAINCGSSSSNKCADLVWGYSEKEIMPKEVFEKGILVPFEGEYRSVPIGFDVFLSNVYGDYMKLPPVENRIPHHDVVAYQK